MDESAAGHPFSWRERTYPSGRWRRLFARTVAHTDVVAPNGRAYVVRVIRLLWPPAGRQNAAGGWPVEEADAIPAVLATRVVWGVRVFDESRRFPSRPLVFGEEWRGRENAVRRALEIAEGLSQGPKP